MCSTDNILAERTKSIFIVLPKQPGSTEGGRHRTISLMSQITKLLLRIILLRIKVNIRHEVAEEHFDFVQGKGTTNVIYILRTVAEKAIEVQKDLYVLCFIDYTKAFETIRHAKLRKLLQALSVDGKDLRIVKNFIGNKQQQFVIRMNLPTLWRPKEGFVKDVCFHLNFFPFIVNTSWENWKIFLASRLV